MRLITFVSALVGAVLLLNVPGQADESTKLTIFTFSNSVQLPGVTLEAGKYRFELADPEESRRVIKVSNEDSKKPVAMLLTIPHTIPDPAKDPVVLFGETAANEPAAVKAWVYPGERTGYEFIYPHDEAMRLAKRYHTSVLSKSGEKIERVNEDGTTVPDSK